MVVYQKRRINCNINQAVQKYSWLDTIPIVGHIKTLKYYQQGNEGLATKAFKLATHKTGVISFGVIGGHYGGVSGSFAGCVIGGLFADVPISIFTSTPYGYVAFSEKIISRNMIACEWFQLLQLLFQDSLFGFLAWFAYDKYTTVMQSGNTIQNCFSLLKELEKVFDIQMKSDVNHQKWVEGIPILSDINAMIQEYDRWKSPAKAFKWALHKTGVTCFGICAGHFAGLISIEAGIVGSIIGGIIGGLFVDAKISEVSLAPYGYCRSFEKLRSKNMEKYALTQLLLLAVKDGITGVKTLIAYNMFNLASQAICNKKLLFETNRIGLKDEMGKDRSGTTYVLNIQRDMTGCINMHEHTTIKGNGKEIKCYSDACERFDVTTGKGYSYILKVLKLIIVGSGEVKKIPVDDISQLERGDHVVYERLMYGKFRLYDHHAIVEKLFPEKSKYRVYEQSSSSEPNKYGLRGKAWIKEIEKPFETKSLFKKDHEDSEISKENRRKTAHYICHHARPVEFEKTYNVLFNNCEHFVTVCSLRLHESQQVQEVIAGIIQCCIITILYFIGGKLTAMESSIDTDIDTTASDVHMYYKRFRDLRTRTGCFWD